jgi:hypothetical protein
MMKSNPVKVHRHFRANTIASMDHSWVVVTIKALLRQPIATKAATGSRTGCGTIIRGSGYCPTNKLRSVQLRMSFRNLMVFLL